MIRGSIIDEFGFLQDDSGTPEGMSEERPTTLSRCSATACHQYLISCLSSFFSVSSTRVFEVAGGGVFSAHPPLVN